MPLTDEFSVAITFVRVSAADKALGKLRPEYDDFFEKIKFIS